MMPTCNTVLHRHPPDCLPAAVHTTLSAVQRFLPEHSCGGVPPLDPHQAPLLAKGYGPQRTAMTCLEFCAAQMRHDLQWYSQAHALCTNHAESICAMHETTRNLCGLHSTMLMQSAQTMLRTLVVRKSHAVGLYLSLSLPSHDVSRVNTFLNMLSRT